MNVRTRRVLLTAALLLLGSYRTVSAAAPPTGDVFLAGYVSAIVVREFAIENPAVSVQGGMVTLRASALTDIEKDRLRTALSELKGVVGVIIEARPSAKAESDPPIMGPVLAKRVPAPPEPEVIADVPERNRVIEPLPGGRLFNPLWADPRWAHFSAAYHNYQGDPELNNVGAVSFGESFGLLGGSAGKNGRWQIDFQAAVFGIFDLDADSLDLINADYWVGIPVSYRNGNFSTIARLFHQSSHLGDEFLLRRRAIDRVNLSYESVDVKSSYEFDNGFRLYGGAGYLVHKEPADLDPWSTQIGMEYAFPQTFKSPISGSAMRPVAAFDLQNREENEWRGDLSLRAGIQYENPAAKSQRVQLLLEYFNGRSPNGQFYDRAIEYIGLGMHVYLE